MKMLYCRWIHPWDGCSLASNLLHHKAGEYINKNSDDLFRRETDKFILHNIRIQSLDVVADKIARTAHAALKLINDIQVISVREIKMAWDPCGISEVNVIEVCLAATLKCYGISDINYRDKKKGLNARYDILKQLTKHIHISDNVDLLEMNADALDSVICLLAAKDFLDGRVYLPVKLQYTKKEG